MHIIFPKPTMTSWKKRACTARMVFRHRNGTKHGSRKPWGELGISYALLSISSPSLYTGNKFRSRELTRKVNEQGAEIVARSPGNLGFLATLPLPHVHSSIFEARYCLDELHADGVGLMTHYGGMYLGDQRLDELMAELDGRGALAVMHPTQPAVMVPDVNEEIPSRPLNTLWRQREPSSTWCRTTPLPAIPISSG